MGAGTKLREGIRIELVARVRTRRAELEDAIVARIHDGTHSQSGTDDVEYRAGLRLAVAAAVEYALLGIERDDPESGSIPSEVGAQARRAAAAGVGLDTVLRRYVLGSTLLGDFLMQEADHSDSAACGAVLRDVLSAQGAVLDRLMAAINSEYTRESERLGRSPEQRRAEHVQRLLVGGPGDMVEFGYELDCWHVGMIAVGVAAGKVVRHVAAGLGSRLLCVARSEDTVWGWLGGNPTPVARELKRTLSNGNYSDVSLAVGEPAHGVDGWRLTHRQAQAALRVALRSPQQLTCYSDVALVASVLSDDLLAGSLVEMYLSPLGDSNNGGAVLRQTLCAYFAAERNASSAASALGVTRHTVENRLRSIEEKLGHTLRTRQAELEVALRLEQLESAQATRG